MKLDLVGGQEQDAARDLFRLAEAAERNMRQDAFVDDLLRNGADHFGADVTGADRIHRDAGARAFERKRLGEAEFAGFRCRIIRLAELPFCPLIDEMLMMRPNLRSRMPSMTGRHMLNSELRLVLITALHCSRLHAVEHGVARDAGIVDHDLDRTDFGFNCLQTLGAEIYELTSHLKTGMPVASLNFCAAASLPA